MAAAKKNRWEREIQELYRLPPEGFVAARTALAQRIATAGEREVGSSIRALNRPTIAVWALNRIARDSPQELEQLFELGDRIRSAQASALRGNREGADELRQASEDERKRLAALIGAVAGALRSAGHEPSASVLGRIEGTLRAVALTPGEGRRLLREGILDREIQPVGFPGSAEVRASPKQLEGKSPSRHPVRAKGKGQDPQLARRANAAAGEAQRKARQVERQAARETAAAYLKAKRELTKWERKVRCSETAAVHLEARAARAAHDADLARKKADAANRQAEEDSRQLQLAKERLAQLSPVGRR